MKKISVILAVALMLVFAFAANAFATQTLTNTPTSKDTATASITAGTSDYAASATGDAAVSKAMTEVGGDTTPDSAHRIHSHYTANTNACAACHAVHTGVGAYLLQWGDGQQTCEACHDGTTNTYDVYGGQIGKTGVMTSGGRFDVTETDGTTHDTSVHNVEGLGATVQLNAAPGGNMAADAKSDKFGGSWNSNFECLSCHDAHGKAGNFRLLNPDVNNYPSTHAVTNGAFTDLDGNHTTFVAVTSDNTFAWINVPGEYPYRTDAIYVNGSAKTIDVDYTFDNKAGYTKVVFKTALAPTDVVTGTYHPSLKVNGTVSGYLTASEQVTHISGMNDFCGACHVDYNTLRVNYAGAGVYYDAAKTRQVMKGSSAYKTLSGSYHAAYRHQVGFINHAGTPGVGTAAKGIDFEYLPSYDKNGAAVTTDVFTCLSCHVSHGTDTTVWKGLETRNASVYTGDEKGAEGGYEGFDGNGVNPNGSRLTRMPGFGVCLTCHNKVAGNEGMGY